MMMRATLVALALATTLPAYAYDWGVDGANNVHVTRIDADYIGVIAGTPGSGNVWFRVDADVGVCPTVSTCCKAGWWLYWATPNFGDADPTIEAARELAAIKATFSSLQLAMALGLKVQLYGYNPSNQRCQIQYIHLLNTP